jgi:hypothetical protein
MIFVGLTLRRNRAKNSGVNFRAENFYAVWRERCRAVNVFRDGVAAPPEKLLQIIWQHQRLRRGELKTADGKTLRVLHPGFASAEGGPDFRGAVLQFGDEPPVAGDVEIDLQANGWHAHGHDQILTSKTSFCMLSGTRSKAQGPKSKVARRK